METVFSSLAVITIVAAVVPLVANRIPNKLVPETVLLLIAGAVLGPYALNIVSVSDAVSLLSELGMAFLFLLAGYEIEPKNLTGRQGRSSIITWLVSFAMAMAIIMALTGAEIGGIGATAAAIALTTTAIGTLMPILAERGILGTRVGDLVFTAIAVIVGLKAKRFRRVGNRAYDFMVDRADSGSQTLVRSTICLLICLVAVSAIFHLDIILGAFAAGFVLRYVVPEGNHSLEQKLEGIGYGFLIPLFFVVSGAGIDLSAIGSKPFMLVVFIVLLLVVRFVPILVSLRLGRETRGMRWYDRVTVAFYCTTALPLIVAVTNVAVSAGAMDSATASVMVAAGAISVFLMPLLASVCQRVVAE